MREYHWTPEQIGNLTPEQLRLLCENEEIKQMTTADLFKFAGEL